jgi:tetratricopeptide (TPR) repeat protein
MRHGRTLGGTPVDHLAAPHDKAVFCSAGFGLEWAFYSNWLVRAGYDFIALPGHRASEYGGAICDMGSAGQIPTRPDVSKRFAADWIGRAAETVLPQSAAAAVLLLVISVSAAWAADQNMWDKCQQAVDTSASIAACTQILQAPDETTSNRAIAYYVRAGAYKTKGDNDQAIADYTKAIEANLRYAAAYTARGIVHQIKGDNDAAIADYTKAIEIDPRDANAYVGRGMVYRLKGDSDHAIADYTQAIEINPRYAIAYFNRGSIFDAKGERDEAIADFSKAIELTPKDAEAYVRRGNRLSRQGR